MRSVRALPPPTNSASTTSRWCDAATRSAIARIVSTWTAICAVFGATKSGLSPTHLFRQPVRSRRIQRNKLAYTQDTPIFSQFQICCGPHEGIKPSATPLLDRQRLSASDRFNLKMPNLSDPELFALLRDRLFTAVVGDILDREGRWHQFLPQPIKPLDPAYSVVGRAMPVRIEDVAGPQDRPFGRLTDALDALQPGEVYLATGGSMNCAAWGEIMTATARTRGG